MAHQIGCGCVQCRAGTKQRGVVAAMLACPTPHCGTDYAPAQTGILLEVGGNAATTAWLCSWNCVSLYAIGQEINAPAYVEATMPAEPDAGPLQHPRPDIVDAGAVEREVAAFITQTNPGNPHQLMREWARANGVPVNPRGAVSRAVRAAYEAAHASEQREEVPPMPPPRASVTGATPPQLCKSCDSPIRENGDCRCS